MTKIELHADVIGAFWWPIGEQWIKEGCAFDVTAYAARTVGGRLTLRDAVDAFTTEHSGDSSAGVELANAYLVATRRKDARTYTRQWPLSCFPSVRDYLATDED